VKLYPASDGTLACGHPIEFTTLRWIQAEPIPIRSFQTACGAGEILLDRRTAVRGALPLCEEVVRPQRTTKGKEGYQLLATLNI
jgi:hypothetical protein